MNPNLLALADLAVDCGDGRIPAGEIRRIGQKRPDLAGRRLNGDLDAAQQGERAARLRNVRTINDV